MTKEEFVTRVRSYSAWGSADSAPFMVAEALLYDRELARLIEAWGNSVKAVGDYCKARLEGRT